jgi:hypothetical protein
MDRFVEPIAGVAIASSFLPRYHSRSFKQCGNTDSGSRYVRLIHAGPPIDCLSGILRGSVRSGIPKKERLRSGLGDFLRVLNVISARTIRSRRSLLFSDEDVAWDDVLLGV